MSKQGGKPFFNMLLRPAFAQRSTSAGFPGQASLQNDFFLTIPEGAPARQARAWLWLGVLALLGSGLFVVLIVLSRTPYVQDIFPYVAFFRTALVVHVDLSVLVWFLAFCGVIWSLNSQPRGAYWGWLAIAAVSSGAVVMVLAAFAGDARPLMNNYVPVLQQPMFLSGLGLVGAGATVQVLRSLFYSRAVSRAAGGEAALRFGVNTSVVAGAMAVLAFAGSFSGMPSRAAGADYYEALFWGSGHVQQFVFTQMMMVVWLWLAHAAGVRALIGPRAVLFLFAWGMLSLLMTPVVYLVADVGSVLHHELFTWQMAFGGSLASLPIALAVVAGMITTRRESGSTALVHGLVWSMVLFGLGGVLGFLIDRSDVTIPAHYHGAIVGVTLAFMAMCYHLLPRLGYLAPGRRITAWQVNLYGAGQMLHVSGLAWAGAEGIQRKTAGVSQGLDTVERLVAMGVMGVGGAISIIGGVLFLVVMLRCMRRPRYQRAGAVLDGMEGLTTLAGLAHRFRRRTELGTVFRG